MDKSVPLNALSLEQLVGLERQTSEEIEQLVSVLEKCRSKQRETSVAIASAGFLKESCSKQMMIPITDSMYVKGVTGDAPRLLMNIGTGYFAEVSSDHAAKVLSDRLKNLNESTEKIVNVTREKQDMLKAVKTQMQAKKMAMAQ